MLHQRMPGYQNLGKQRQVFNYLYFRSGSWTSLHADYCVVNSFPEDATNTMNRAVVHVAPSGDVCAIQYCTRGAEKTLHVSMNKNGGIILQVNQSCFDSFFLSRIILLVQLMAACSKGYVGDIDPPGPSGKGEVIHGNVSPGSVGDCSSYVFNYEGELKEAAITALLSE